jgi:ribonuclease BN (tRNA processing enzyme)
MPGLTVTLLGSGGWLPSARRETCCALVRKDDHALLVDAGSGLRHIVTSPGLLDGVTQLDIMLTHFHLDHTIGISYLPLIRGDTTVTVWAPGQALCETGSEQVLRRLIAPPLFASPLESIVDGVRELDVGREMPIGAFTVRSRRQDRHSHPTVAFRIDDSVAYCTDTAYDRVNADFTSGAQILFHEAWYAADTTADEAHGSW